MGCLLVKRLLECGHSVRVFDRFCFGEEPLSFSLPPACGGNEGGRAQEDCASFAGIPHCEIVQGDIRRLQEVPELFDGIDAVAHLAGLSHDPSCNLDPDMTADVNVESTRELANHACRHGVKRFVFGSTCAVYGRGVFVSVDEESPPNPVSSFGASKLEAERLLMQMQGEHFEPVIARTATMFGWSPRMRFDLAINQMVASAMQHGCIRVMGGGNQWRPFVHVDDAARAFAALLEGPAAKVAGHIFNVGDDEANVRIIDLARRVADGFSNIDIEIPKDDDDQRTYHVSFAKLKDAVSFESQHSIDDGIREVRDMLMRGEIDPFSEPYFNFLRMKRLRSTPVDEGGEPIAARFIHIAKPCLGAEEEQAVLEVMRSGWLTSGPHLPAFETAFGETVSAPHTLAVTSCTAALHLCLVDAGVQPGDEVITSPITWASTGNTIMRMGAKVVFADLKPNSLNIDPASIERAITDRTRAIIPVHMAGLPCDLDEIRAIAEKRGIPVIEDAAHALGAAYKGTPIGGYGAYTCFSFYAIKNITTMEGGTITVRDAASAERLRLLGFHGIAATAWERYGRSAVPAPAEVTVPGFKYAMSNVSAAIGLEQLKRFPSFKATRRRLAGMYTSVLADVDEITLPETADDREHAWHLYIIRLKLDKLRKTRDEIAAALRRENIGTSINFYGLHLHQYYREVLGMKPEHFPNATAASYEVLSLPLHPQMTDKNAHEVVEALKKVIAHAQ